MPADPKEARRFRANLSVLRKVIRISCRVTLRVSFRPNAHIRTWLGLGVANLSITRLSVAVRHLMHSNDYCCAGAVTV